LGVVIITTEAIAATTVVTVMSTMTVGTMTTSTIDRDSLVNPGVWTGTGRELKMVVDSSGPYLDFTAGAARCKWVTGAWGEVFHNFGIYMIDDDELGRRFVDLLLQKQAEGVQVNLIYDGLDV
jgi:hypothetical protein